MLDFVAFGSPAWMDRGLINPSSLILNLNIEMPPYIKPSCYLLGSLKDRLDINCEIPFNSNYSLGMVVFPENIEEFKNFFLNYDEKFSSYLIKNGFSKNNANLCLKKIHEAIMYACQRKQIFVESTDIFSGPMGIVT